MSGNSRVQCQAIAGYSVRGRVKRGSKRERLARVIAKATRKKENKENNSKSESQRARQKQQQDGEQQHESKSKRSKATAWGHGDR